MEEATDAYEFDAPTRGDLRDFQLEDNADQWFEQVTTPEVINRLTTPGRPEVSFGNSRGDLPKAVISPMVSNAGPTSEVPSNIVLSWGDNRPATSAPAQAKARPPQPLRVSKRSAVQNETKPAAPVTPPVKKQRRVPVQTRTVVKPHRRSLTGSAARGRGRRRSVGASQKAKPKTVPAAAGSPQKSTEQQEMERIKALQHEVAEHRRRNEASYKAALAGGHVPKKQVLSTTVPKEFNFCSDARVKSTNDGASGSGATAADFTAQLRKHPASPAKAPKGATIPKPFNLSCGSKRKLDETSASAAYVPMAQMIEQYEKRTPVRYRLRSRQSQERGPCPGKTEPLKITSAQTPQLQTRQRSRPVLVKSSAEIEEEELEKMQQFKFKALELNRKILDAAVVPKKPSAKEATRPEGFQLEIEKRLQERQASRKAEEPEVHAFHSRPLPVKILEDVVGVPEKKVQNPTVPESPAFALKNRIRVERKPEEVKPPAPVKALPVPHFLPFQPKLPVKSKVEVCPFSFEERERERRALKEKKLEELRNEEVPKFKALPLPDFHEVSLPEKKVVEPTKPEPFKLTIDERGAVKNDRWEHMMKEEQKRQAEAASFKARPNTVTHKEPFLPKKENRSILDGTNSVAPEAFQLCTERRAQDRLEFEREKSAKEALRAQMEERRLQEEEEKEKEQITRLRQEQVHKAQPIRRYRKLEVKKSEMSLTVPQSPNFSDRFRM
ncbi:targeting protein for Xklp2-like isoform X1 [Denticeps clupeoides]|uniref:targeting protein for Xklp2-like isoform X4 n=1 Tax=Denticeps clupeoides TaxID=299321 RepID=UPI0010A34E88|nr:targeting protein for Xklp2-like isoform X4 [Denticeps clupeoides]XP_028850106.1 targeting protein for Xklp2-like isoform X1 [Denticeps clupeoides]